MPSGKVHTKTTGFIAVSSLFFFYDFHYSMMFSFGCLIGTVITPDLDVDSGNYGYTIIKILFGDVSRDLWKWFWSPYAKLLPHRHFFSHFPVIGTILRLFYVFWPFLIYFRLFGVSFRLSDFFPLVFGLILVDSVHFIMDILSTWLKRKFT